MLNPLLWQFFTPEIISKFMIKLLEKYIDGYKNNKNISVFEPSFWEWVFISWLVNLISKNKYNKLSLNIFWTEIDKNLFNKTSNKYKKINKNIKINLENKDFFDLIKDYKKINKKIDFIIWNPLILKIIRLIEKLLIK